MNDIFPPTIEEAWVRINLEAVTGILFMSGIEELAGIEDDAMEKRDRLARQIVKWHYENFE